MTGRRLAAGGRVVLALAIATGAAACKGEPDPFPWCSAGEEPPAPAGAPTYFADVKPLLDQKCGRCHVEGGIGPFPLDTLDAAVAHAAASEVAILDGHMPPFLAERCCNDYFQDFSLTPEEIALFRGWVEGGTPAGDEAATAPPREPIGGLSRVDVELAMDEPYLPAPTEGTDDLRCFVLDWPYDETVFVTGLEPVPGTRSVVHHLIVAAIHPDSVEELEARDDDDPGAGFDCSGGFGGFDLRDVKPLGGSLLGGDFPRGIGAEVEAGSKILLNVHYSTVKGAAEDRTAVRFRVDDDAEEAKSIPVANPAWLVGGGMEVEAGDPDAAFFYAMEPDLFTRDRPVLVQNVVPHMHEYATSLRVLAKHDDGATTCLLEIADWHFGWEQPFWLAEPVLLGDDDELYVECHFDNSAANQPDGGEPRDFAWGGDDQDMCAAFVAFTEAP